MELEETLLPGVGVRYEMTTRAEPGRLRAGTALVARGEFSIVIAGLAVAAGIPDVGPVATAYVLLLAVAGPVLTRFVEPFAAPFTPRAA